MDSKKYWKSIMQNPEDYEKLKLYKNLKCFIFDVCKKYSTSIALKWSDGEATYEKLLTDIKSFAASLADKGFEKGDNIGLVFKNEYDFVVSFFACSILGLVSAELPSSLNSQQIVGLSRLFCLKGLVFNDDFDVNEVIISSNINLINIKNQTNINLQLPDVEINENDPVCIVFTGGTTGNPKGALLSHKNLCVGALNGAYVPDKAFGLKYLSLIPFTHIFGLVKNLLSCFISGSTLYVVKNPMLFAKEAMTYQPEVMVLTPGLASVVLSLLQNYGPQVFGPSFKTIIAGGAEVPASLINNFKKFNIKCMPGYGLTEATNLVSGNVNIDTKASSVGILYPNQEGKIVDGELWIKGANIFLGYFGNPIATENMFSDGWLKTGDLARFDEEGFLYITGRKSNLIIMSSGLKISPESVENILSENSLIKDSIVRKAKDSDNLTAEILLKENTPENQNSIKKYVNDVANKKINNANISDISFRSEDFKRTPAMKIIRD